MKATAHLVGSVCYSNKDRLMAGMICAGWDAVDGGSVYAVPLGGACVKVPFAIGGSGSTYIYGHVDATFRRGMTRDECMEFVRNGARWPCFCAAWRWPARPSLFLCWMALAVAPVPLPRAPPAAVVPRRAVTLSSLLPSSVHAISTSSKKRGRAYSTRSRVVVCAVMVSCSGFPRHGTRRLLWRLHSYGRHHP